MSTEFEAVIGLEVHCQLSTHTKAFCGCKARLPSGMSVANEAVNLNTCPICTGHPGTLPVLNKKAVEFAIRAGLATHCRINLDSVFARKNYFYPDLPKGYQISQFDKPLCEEGWLEIPSGSEKRKIQIQRIHMEEDAGKNVHMSGFSLVNLNRSGVPLIEIVSGPDLRTPEEAGDYLRALYSIVTYLEICDGNLQEGNFRCDANVSVRPKGSTKFGTRAEIKNVNSFRFVEKAIEYEIRRQIEIVKSGGKVVQETRGFDSAKNVTISQRSKEEAHDYRYFPDPDLIPLRLQEQWIQKIKSELPELPEQKRARYINEYRLSEYDSSVLTQSKETAGYFQTTMDTAKVMGFPKEGLDLFQIAKGASNLISGELARIVNEQGKSINQLNVLPEHTVQIVIAQETGSISSTSAKQIIPAIMETGESVEKIIESKGLKQVSDTAALMTVVEKVIAENSAQFADFKGGKDKLLGFFIGQAMKASQGKGNPEIFNELFLQKKIEKKGES